MAELCVTFRLRSLYTRQFSVESQRAVQYSMNQSNKWLSDLEIVAMPQCCVTTIFVYEQKTYPVRVLWQRKSYPV